MGTGPDLFRYLEFRGGEVGVVGVNGDGELWHFYWIEFDQKDVDIT